MCIKHQSPLQVWSTEHIQSGKCLFIFSCMRESMNFMRVEQSCKISDKTQKKKPTAWFYSLKLNFDLWRKTMKRGIKCNWFRLPVWLWSTQEWNCQVSVNELLCRKPSEVYLSLLFCSVFYSRAQSWFVEWFSVSFTFEPLRSINQRNIVTPNPDGVLTAPSLFHHGLKRKLCLFYFFIKI